MVYFVLLQVRTLLIMPINKSRNLLSYSTLEPMIWYVAVVTRTYHILTQEAASIDHWQKQHARLFVSLYAPYLSTQHRAVTLVAMTSLYSTEPASPKVLKWSFPAGCGYQFGSKASCGPWACGTSESQTQRNLSLAIASLHFLPPLWYRFDRFRPLSTTS